MNPNEYCYQKAIVPGSAFYYSIKKLSLAEREAIIAIQAFYQEIEEVIFHFTDLGVAQARLNWWREEVIKIFQGQPNHPVSICLQQYKINPEKLLSMIDGMEQNLSHLVFATYDEVIVHFMRTAGERELLFANVLQVEMSKEQIYQCMLVIELSQYLQYLRKYVQRDLIYFSEDELKKFTVQRLDFQNFKTTAEIRALLQFQFEKIKRVNVKSVPKFFQVRVEIANATAKEIASSQFAVLENFIDLTPLRRWWIS
jgi:phytoene synthase